MKGNMGLVDFYGTLAEKRDIDTLVLLARFDERVYDVVNRHDLLGSIFERLPEPQFAHFFADGVVYDPYNRLIIKNFIKICMLMSRYEGAEQGCALAHLIGNCGLPEQYRLQLFAFSESYRHMILSKSYFVQRAVLRLLAYIFCDDVLSDAVAQLQYKSDILNHVNRVFTDTADFVSWRFSVRVLSLGGGYNEDRSDVDRTELLCDMTTRAVPQFLTYYVLCFLYARIRFYPTRVRGITPKWLARQRAMFSALYCSVLGVMVNAFTDVRVHRQRVLYEARKSQEFRRRKGAQRRGIDYAPNSYFDSLEGPTRRVFTIQCQSYVFCACGLAFSVLPLSRVNFPKWMGDVPWRHPFLPRLFPALVGLHAASRCAVPFVIFPFFAASAIIHRMRGSSLYDHYVEARMRMWSKKHEAMFDVSSTVEVDITEEVKR
jgi:hypothetical protein